MSIENFNTNNEEKNESIVNKYPYEADWSPERKQFEFLKNEIWIINTTLSGDRALVRDETFSPDDTKEEQVAKIVSKMKEIIEGVESLKQ